MKRKELLHIYDGYIFMREEILLMTKKMKNNLYKKNARHAHNYNIRRTRYENNTYALYVNVCETQL